MHSFSRHPFLGTGGLGGEYATYSWSVALARRDRMENTASRIAARVESVRERVRDAARRSGRAPEQVRLIAVTKGVDVARIEQVLACGVMNLGENRVQEALPKISVVTAPATWHMVGHVQTNKASRAAAAFDVVHSVDSDRVARALSSQRGDRPALRVLIEVELTGLHGRFGATAADTSSLVRGAAMLESVDVVGLMTIAPPAPDPEAARPFFQRLRALRDDVQRATGVPLPELSMGMSGDFEVAVEEGATMVRVGQAIFDRYP